MEATEIALFFRLRFLGRVVAALDRATNAFAGFGAAGAGCGGTFAGLPTLPRFFGGRPFAEPTTLCFVALTGRYEANHRTVFDDEVVAIAAHLKIPEVSDGFPLKFAVEDQLEGFRGLVRFFGSLLDPYNQAIFFFRIEKNLTSNREIPIIMI